MIELAAYSKTDVDQIHDAFQRGLNALGGILVGDGLKDYIDMNVENSHDTCATETGHGILRPPEENVMILEEVIEESHWMLIGAASFALLVFFACIWCCTARCCFYHTVGQTKLAKARAAAGREYKRQMRKNSRALAGSQAVSWFAFFTIPIALVINTLLFVSGHLSLGATVDLDLTIFSEPLQLLPLVEFSMAKSIGDMLKAQAYALAVVMIIFSVMWPYFKILVTFLMSVSYTHLTLPTKA